MSPFIVWHETATIQWLLKIPESDRANLSFLIYALLNISYKFRSHPIHKYITVAALKLHRHRTQKIDDTWGNHRYTGFFFVFFFKEKNGFKSQHLILYHLSLEKNSTDCRIRAQHCSCSPDTRAVGSFCNGTFVVFSPTAELNWRALVLVYWIIRVLL